MHHAHLLIGEREAAEKHLHELCRHQGLTLIGSPDFFLFAEPLFGIDEARKLSEQAVRKAFVEKKIFFIAPERITLEAQNALLKTFEDPVPDTHFFLSVREEHLIIPTLRSRMEVLHLANEAGEASEAKNFLKLSLKDRLEFVRKFVDKERNLSAFLDELMKALRGSGSAGVRPLKKVYEARRYSDDRAASVRLILEHLAVVL